MTNQIKGSKCPFEMNMCDFSVARHQQGIASNPFHLCIEIRRKLDLGVDNWLQSLDGSHRIFACEKGFRTEKLRSRADARIWCLSREYFQILTDAPCFACLPLMQ
jgi:hypothetical protein